MKLMILFKIILSEYIYSEVNTRNTNTTKKRYRSNEQAKSDFNSQLYF